MNFKQAAEADFKDRHNVIIGFIGKEDEALSALPEKLATQSRDWRDQQWIDTKVGAVTPVLQADGAQLMLIGTGDTLQFTENTLKKLAAGIAGIVKKSRQSAISVLTDNLRVTGRSPDWLVTKLVEWTLTASYRYDATKSEKNPEFTTETFYVVGEGEFRDAIQKGRAVAHGVNVARELGNLPPNICTPTYLSNQAQKLADRYANVHTDILEEAEMDNMGMGAFMAVSRGSEQSGKMVVMHYKGAGDDVKPHVLVGKGITFDTGGISLKPAAKMDEMKYDMGGAASVFGTLSALAELQPKVNVVGIVAAAENMPSGRATRPGDVVTTLSGKTVEILNTDAEGRLVLCDALTYAERYEPQSVVDMATLTGAIVVGLGHHPIGLYSNTEALRHELEQSGNEAWDRAWPMPLWEDYREELDSPYADLRNIGQGPAGGSITAATYLAEFTRNYPWAHLDIAGAAWTTAKDGATGRPVGLLTEYLISKA